MHLASSVSDDDDDELEEEEEEEEEGFWGRFVVLREAGVESTRVDSAVEEAEWAVLTFGISGCCFWGIMAWTAFWSSAICE